MVISFEEMSKDCENAALQKDLESYNETFKRMINLIPASFYFSTVDKDKLDSAVPTEPVTFTGKKRKRGSKDKQLGERGKKLRNRFNPETQLPVTDLQERLIEQEDSEKNKKKHLLGKNSIENANSSREKLHVKINQLREKRKAPEDADSLQKKREKRKERRKEKKSKLNNKHRYEKANKVKGVTINRTEKLDKLPVPSKPYQKDEGNMVFSRFDFNETKKKGGKKGGKNYKKLLEDISERKNKLNELKQTDEEKAKAVEKKMSWQSALQKAEGIKVKDNPDLIKKSLKKRQERKRQSKKKWDERNKQVEKALKEKQEKWKKGRTKSKRGKSGKKETKISKSKKKST